MQSLGTAAGGNHIAGSDERMQELMARACSTYEISEAGTTAALEQLSEM
jgi:hypothetical protein